MARRPVFAAGSSALLCLMALVWAGCGGGGSSSQTSSTSAVLSPPPHSAATAVAGRRPAPRHRAAVDRPPESASPTLRAIYATFPPPQPNPEDKRSAKAIEAGERACRGKTPLQVKAEFYPAAQANLKPEQRQMIDRIASFENNAPKNSSFTAGQLAADVYEATLPAALGRYGYQGCIYGLARRLEKRLAPR